MEAMESILFGFVTDPPRYQQTGLTTRFATICGGRWNCFRYAAVSAKRKLAGDTTKNLDTMAPAMRARVAEL